MRCQAAFDTLFVVVVLTVGVRAQSNAPDPASSRLSHRPAPSDSCSCCPPRERSRSVQDVIRDALAILPEQPAYVSVIDVDAQEDPRIRQALRPLEAFTVPGNRAWYVSLQGGTLRRLLESRDKKFVQLRRPRFGGDGLARNGSSRRRRRTGCPSARGAAVEGFHE